MQKTKSFSHILTDKIPPIRMKPVKDAFKKMTLRTFLSWLIGISLLLLVSNVLTQVLTQPQYLGDLIRASGFWAPLILILVILLEILITPLPASISAITAGYFFGVFPGVIYAWIGTALAVLIAFLLARHFGQPLVRKMLSSRIFDFYSDLIKTHPLILALIYAIPIFPGVVISFLVGLSGIKLSRFLLLSWPSLIINMLILTTLGARIAIVGFTNGFVIAGILLLTLGGLFLLTWSVRKAQRTRKDVLLGHEHTLENSDVNRKT